MTGRDGLATTRQDIYRVIELLCDVFERCNEPTVPERKPRRKIKQKVVTRGRFRSLSLCETRCAVVSCRCRVVSLSCLVDVVVHMCLNWSLCRCCVFQRGVSASAERFALSCQNNRERAMWPSCEWQTGVAFIFRGLLATRGIGGGRCISFKLLSRFEHDDAQNT